jgi:hypothetical protein
MTRFTADLPGMPNSPSALSPTWQCVMVCWGDKYSVELINHLMAQIERHAQTPPRFVLICDQPKPGLRPGAMMRDFPAFFLTPIFKKSGCQAKLAMFEKGVLPEDLPAIYIDLDTIVLGDISKGLKLMDTPQTVAMLPSAIIPFGPIGRTLWKWTDKKKLRAGQLLHGGVSSCRVSLRGRNIPQLVRSTPGIWLSPHGRGRTLYQLGGTATHEETSQDLDRQISG